MSVTLYKPTISSEVRTNFNELNQGMLDFEHFSFLKSTTTNVYYILDISM